MRRLLGWITALDGRLMVAAISLLATHLTATPSLGGCGCMDVALIVDDTGSMGGAIDNVKAELPQIIAAAQAASGGDLRIGLVTFPSDNVVVNVPFTTDVVPVEAAIQALIASGGAGEPESSDESLQFVVTGAADASCTVSNGPFGSFRTGCVKIAVLITDAHPGGCHDSFTPGVDDVHAHTVAVDAEAAGVLVSAIYVPTGGETPEIKSVMQDYADTSGGVFVETATDGTGTAEGISDILTTCGSGGSKLDITRTARFWFTHGFSSITNCATLLSAIQFNSGIMNLGFATLPTANRNGDNVANATDAFIEALSFYWRSAGITGEAGGNQNAKLRASALCTARKQMAVELIAATANLRLLGTKPANATYVNGGTVTNFPPDLIQQARTAAAGFDVTAIHTMTALLKKFNSSGLTNDLPNGLLECSPQTGKTLKPIARDPTTQDTCPGINDTCGAAQTIVFSGSKPLFKSTVSLNTYHDDVQSPSCGGGGPDAVWKVSLPVAAAGRQFSVSTAGSNFDTLLSVWSGTCSNLLEVGCADSTLTTGGEQLTFTTDGSNTFFIVVEGKGGAFGKVKMSVTSF